MQVVDEAIKQFVGGVEIQLLGFAWIGFLEDCSQASHPCRQPLLVGRQRCRQTGGVGAGQSTTAEAVEHFGEILQTRSDRGNHMFFAVAAQAFKQLMQRVEARGDAHELAVQTTQSAVAPTHVRVFEHGHAAQAFKAHGFSDEAYVTGLERLGFAAPAQAIGDEQREHAEALIQGVAHGGAGGLRQDRGADQGRAENPQRDLQHSPNRCHERAVRVRQRG
ncbi:hypothetical protein D3C87_990960 [compost metagenome]